MATDSTSNQPVQPENEIDLIEVVKKLWAKRKFILKVTVVCACLGILVALFSAKVFTASCTIVPQTGEKNDWRKFKWLSCYSRYKHRIFRCRRCVVAEDLS